MAREVAKIALVKSPALAKRVSCKWLLDLSKTYDNKGTESIFLEIRWWKTKNRPELIELEAYTTTPS